MRLAVLLVGPSAPRLADVLDRDARLEAFAAESDGAARAYLSGTAFDRVVVLGPSDAADLARSLGLTVCTLGADADAADILDALRLAPPETHAASARTPAPVGDDTAEAVRLIQALRGDIDRVAHDLNNPVAVILGNAQLARELGTDDTDPTVLEALADIETASGELAARVRELGALRTRVDAALVALGGGETRSE